MPEVISTPRVFQASSSVEDRLLQEAKEIENERQMWRENWKLSRDRVGNREEQGGGENGDNKTEKESDKKTIIERGAGGEFWVEPLKNNLYEWHFTVRGPSNSEFEGGIYHGTVILPPQYPLLPPEIVFSTPSGHFPVGEKIPLSISEDREQESQLGVRTAVVSAIALFAPNSGEGSESVAEKKSLAKLSRSWHCPSCGKTNEENLPEIPSQLSISPSSLISSIFSTSDSTTSSHFLPSSTATSITSSSSKTPWIIRMNGLKARLERMLGEGGLSRVYRASISPIAADPATLPPSIPTVMAVKKSRASLRLKRTMLHYEAQVMLKLQGHTAIPEVFGYGRMVHFEYLAMETLGRDLAAVVRSKTGNELGRWVAEMMVQMLSALQYVHSLGFIHRDIKPNNILVRVEDPSKICLIDWGMAIPYGSAREKEQPEEPEVLCGTSSFASLNAHEGQDLTCRDDLISLGYTMLYLLRGSLPWQMPYFRHASSLSLTRQIRERKRNWSATRLSKGFPITNGVTFQKFAAKVLPLGFNETIDYQHWQNVFSEIANTEFFLPSSPKFEKSEWIKKSALTAPLQPVVSPGQLICARLSPRLSLEGPTMRERILSFWHDPSISDSQFSTTNLPAVVLAVSKGQDGQFWNVTLAALTLADPDTNMLQYATLLKVYDDHDRQSLETSEFPEVKMVPELPPFLGKKVWCYAYPRPFIVSCDPEQIRPILSPWHLGSDVADRLLELFPPLEYNAGQVMVDNPANSDISMVAKLASYSKWVFVKLSSLDPNLGNQTSHSTETPDWYSRRAWVVDFLKICRARAKYNNRAWDEDRGRLDLDNSYYQLDIDFWMDCHQFERDTELTLAGGGERDDIDVDSQILRIVDVEVVSELECSDSDC